MAVPCICDKLLLIYLLFCLYASCTGSLSLYRCAVRALLPYLARMALRACRCQRDALTAWFSLAAACCVPPAGAGAGGASRFRPRTCVRLPFRIARTRTLRTPLPLPAAARSAIARRRTACLRRCVAVRATRALACAPSCWCWRAAATQRRMPRAAHIHACRRAFVPSPVCWFAYHAAVCCRHRAAPATVSRAALSVARARSNTTLPGDITLRARCHLTQPALRALRVTLCGVYVVRAADACSLHRVTVLCAPLPRCSPFYYRAPFLVFGQHQALGVQVRV